MMSRVLAALAVVCGAAVLFAPRPFAVVGGLLLGFVLPGMALLGVLFRRRALTTVERAVLTPALSMGVLIVAGLLIHVTGLRIDRLAWTVATVVVTVAAVITARLLPARRVRAVQTVGAPVPPPPAPPLAPSGMAEANTVVMSVVPLVTTTDREQTPRRLLRQFLPLVLVAVVLGGAGWLSFDTSRDTHHTVVTTLSAAPPGPVDSAGNRTVRVSATGLLAADGPYTVRVTGSAATATVERTVAVTGDGTWSEALNLPGAQRLTVNLYRSGDTTAYRTLFISAVD
jgi:hypothetical protein